MLGWLRLVGCGYWCFMDVAGWFSVPFGADWECLFRTAAVLAVRMPGLAFFCGLRQACAACMAGSGEWVLWQAFCGARCLRPAERAAADDRPDSGRRGVGREPRRQWRAWPFAPGFAARPPAGHAKAPPFRLWPGRGRLCSGVSPRCRRGCLRGAGGRGLCRPYRRRAVRRPCSGWRGTRCGCCCAWRRCSFRLL